MKIRFAIIFGIFAFCSSFAQEAKPMPQLMLTDVNDMAASLPDMGKKVLLVFYLDPDVQTISDSLAEAINEKKYPADKFAAIGVANCKDTWLPGRLIRIFAKKKQQHFPKSLILLDENHTLDSAWSIGECNDQVAILILGKDMKLKYFKKISSKNECISIIKSVFSVIENEIKK